MPNYAITMRKTRKPITKQHYLDYLNYCTDLGDVGNVNFEQTKGMHIHFMLKTKKTINYNKLRPTKRGWNCKVVPIFNKRGWIKYCKKDNANNEELNKEVHKQYENAEEEEYIEMPTKNLFRCCNNNTVEVNSP